MVKINLKNKGNKQHLIVGALGAVIASALLPQEYNPVVIVSDLIEKMKTKG